MDIFDEQTSAELNEKELDNIFGGSSFDLDGNTCDKRDLVRDAKTFVRFLRRKIKSFIREKTRENFTNILYVALDCPPCTINTARMDTPLEYITEMRKQYPYNDIRVLIPIIGLKENMRPTKKIVIERDGGEYVLEKTSLHFSFFLQNKIQEAIIYKYPKNVFNVDVYGVYCESFSGAENISEISGIEKLASYMKAVRLAVRKFKRLGFTPDIVHAENIPYYLGGEFEIQLPGGPKILQIVKDFTQIDMIKPEAFWAGINLADEAGMSKICKDPKIKKCLARLFNLKETKKFTRMRECLEFIYANYTNFRKYVSQGEDLEENVIFNRLNARMIEIFPQLSEGGLYYNQMAYTIKKADFWAVNSKTYYKEIFESPKIAGKISFILEDRKERSSYVSCGFNLYENKREEGKALYQSFSEEDFRIRRNKNKSVLLKEFASDRIKTNFMDPTLFKNQSPLVLGNLDSFYEGPLLFYCSSNEIFANGIDILFNSVLKLLELHKNIRIIICIKDGLNNNFIKSWVEFLAGNKYFNGRWVFIDGEINQSKFLAGTDMILIPRRINMTSPEHFLAMYYGCVPIVARSGILNDTVVDIFDDITLGCGFKTKNSLLTEDDNPDIFLSPLMKALNLYQNNPSSWRLLIKNCMKHDSRWNFKILERYNKIYQELL